MGREKEREREEQKVRQRVNVSAVKVTAKIQAAIFNFLTDRYIFQLCFELVCGI